jgi:glycosyltransferase involved in cell wall biosynthesis
MFEPDRIGHQIGLPNKIFESMVTGRPIVVTKDMYYSNEFVEKEKFGLGVTNDEESIKKAVIKLRDDLKLQEQLGKNGIKAAIEKYNWEKEKIKLLEVYKGLK